MGLALSARRAGPTFRDSFTIVDRSLRSRLGLQWGWRGGGLGGGLRLGTAPRGYGSVAIRMGGADGPEKRTARSVRAARWDSRVFIDGGGRLGTE